MRSALPSGVHQNRLSYPTATLGCILQPRTTVFFSQQSSKVEFTMRNPFYTGFGGPGRGDLARRSRHQPLACTHQPELRTESDLKKMPVE